jgi:hypothetical protein
MPFKVAEAKQHINSLVYVFNKQKLHCKYNAGEKYAALEEKIEKDGLDELSTNGDADDVTIKELRLRLCELLCMVLEEHDIVDADDKPVPINPKQLASLGLPLEFYSGWSNAISEDFNSRAGGTKSSS